MEHLGGDRADEVDVVTDENQCAFVLKKRLRQTLDAVDVEVRRRLVHQQKVRRVDEKLHQIDPTLFAPGEDFALFEDVFPAEQEAAENGTGVIFAQGRTHPHHFIHHRAFRLESGAPMLAEIPQLEL